MIGTITVSNEASDDAVFRLAKHLAKAALPAQDAISVARNLDRREYIKHTKDDSQVYGMTVRGFQEFGLSVSRRSGVLEVSLWGTGH